MYGHGRGHKEHVLGRPCPTAAAAGGPSFTFLGSCTVVSSSNLNEKFMFVYDVKRTYFKILVVE